MKITRDPARYNASTHQFEVRLSNGELITGATETQVVMDAEARLIVLNTPPAAPVALSCGAYAYLCGRCQDCADIESPAPEVQKLPKPKKTKRAKIRRTRDDILTEFRLQMQADYGRLEDLKRAA